MSLYTMSLISAINGGTNQVLVEKKSFVGVFTLNRPKKLNALSFEMVSRLLELFTVCAENSSVKLIILKGNGRTFCAGGDVIAILRDVFEDDWHAGAKFFRQHYTLNYVIATYSKPQVSILDGIVMGGGAGVSIHGKFRVATEKSIFAMPEAAIGYIPDVGASFFLSRLPGFFGEYLGLTGARLDGAEMLACGLATHFVPSERLSLLEDALVKADSSDLAVISSLIQEFAETPKLKGKSVYHKLKTINECFSRRTIEEIIAALEKLVESKDDWICSTVESLHKASPTCLKLFLRSIREGRFQDISKCLVREFRVGCRLLQKDISNDHFEGYRAMLVDKDKNPKWEPSKFELVTDEMVDRFFSRMTTEEDLELPLSSKSNLLAYAAAKL